MSEINILESSEDDQTMRPIEPKSMIFTVELDNKIIIREVLCLN